MKNSIIVVGIGHPFRGDDGLGPKAIMQLQSQLPPGIETKSILGDLAEILDIFEHYATVFIIDIIVTENAPPGTRYRLTKPDLKEFAHCCRTSTHAFDLSQALEMAQNLNIMPEKLIIYGIEGYDFSHTDALSLEVTAQIKPLIDDLTREIISYNET